MLRWEILNHRFIDNIKLDVKI